MFSITKQNLFTRLLQSMKYLFSFAMKTLWIHCHNFENEYSELRFECKYFVTNCWIDVSDSIELNWRGNLVAQNKYYVYCVVEKPIHSDSKQIFERITIYLTIATNVNINFIIFYVFFILLTLNCKYIFTFSVELIQMKIL